MFAQFFTQAAVFIHPYKAIEDMPEMEDGTLPNVPQTYMPIRG